MRKGFINMNPSTTRTRTKKIVGEGKDFKATPSTKKKSNAGFDPLLAPKAVVRAVGAVGHHINQYADYGSKQIIKAVKETAKGEDPVKALTNAFNQANSKKKNAYNQPLRNTLNKLNKKK